MPGMTSPGWYPNPDGTQTMRYWDGRAWQQTAPAGAATPGAPAPKKGGKGKWIGIAAAVVAGMFAVSAIIGNGGKEDPSPEEKAAAAAEKKADDARYAASLEDSSASLNCKERVTSMLKSPSTADFPEHPQVRLLANGARQVTGVVDSQNGFGAMVRSEFTCTSTPNGNGTYQVVVDKLEGR